METKTFEQVREMLLALQNSEVLECPNYSDIVRIITNDVITILSHQVEA